MSAPTFFNGRQGQGLANGNNESEQASRYERGGGGRSGVLLLIVGSILSAHAWMLFESARQNFITYDETAYIPAGVAHWQNRDFSLYRVNPPLARMVAVLPLLAMGSEPTTYRTQQTPGQRPEWACATDFWKANATDIPKVVCVCRLAGIAWSLVGGWLVYRWALILYGPGSAFLGVLIWSFEPNILAHAQLATPDIPCSVMGLAAGYAFWRYLREPNSGRAAVAGVMLGVGQLTKFTLLLLFVAWPIITIVYWLSYPRAKPSKTKIFTHAVLIVFLSLVMINMGYAFRGSGRTLGSFPFVSRAFGGAPATGQPSYGNALSGNRFRSSWLGSLPVPLPADYVLGIDLQRRDFEELAKESPSYLAGRWSSKGWLYYYVYALAVKVPVGMFALALWALAWALRNLRGLAAWGEEATLWVPAITIFSCVSLETGLNHHMRYVLPMFPYIAIATSRLGACITSFSRSTPFVVIFVSWAVGSVIAVWPHQLSYFNELVGGPRGGHNHLLGSNLDWGQDLLFLRSWLKNHSEARPLGLAYYNSIDAGVLGIEYELPPRGPDSIFRDDPSYTQSLGPRPGYYAISINFLRGMPARAFDGHGHAQIISSHEYEYFLNYQPIATAGYSIYIYSISLDDANCVRRRLGLPEIESQPDLGGAPQ